ncbi:MAG TPA: hypothetical protein VFD09_07060 [Thiopseudomonas sp.]|nr:hypothetical protein [Thiopseudomonas sp.]
MKTTFLALAFGFIGGAVLSYSQTAKHYEAKARELVEATAKAEQIRADKSKEQVDELYEKWRDAIVIPEPVTVVERVLVKAKCPVQADTSAGLDHGANGVRVELAERTVRSIERVAIKHEQNYKKCAAQLAGAQALLSAE